MRTPGRRPWELKHSLRIGTFVAICMLASSLWFLYGRVELLESPHNPHYEANHCFDCHESMGSKMKADECFLCHNTLDRTLRPGALARRQALVGDKKCSHPIKSLGRERTATALCLSCHKTVTGYVAMANISDGKYAEIDMAITHPIGLLPTETIHPKTLPLSQQTGAIDCITCHDQHAADRRLKMLRYYYPGNGRPADFRPLCLDCHDEGWLPLKVRPVAVREARRHD